MLNPLVLHTPYTEFLNNIHPGGHQDQSYWGRPLPLAITQVLLKYSSQTAPALFQHQQHRENSSL
jgi:hypothetical protein